MFVSPLIPQISLKAHPDRAPADPSFAHLLRQADFSPPAAPEVSQLLPSSTEESPLRTQTREAARALVASAFLVPMLASVRAASFAAGPYAPTLAERRFGPMIDQQIADRVMQGTNFALIDSIVDRIASVDTRA